jgi:hypothetical protein
VLRSCVTFPAPRLALTERCAAPTSYQPSAAPSDSPTAEAFLSAGGGAAVQAQQKRSTWVIVLVGGLAGLALISVVIGIVAGMLVGNAHPCACVHMCVDSDSAR